MPKHKQGKPAVKGKPKKKEQWEKDQFGYPSGKILPEDYSKLMVFNFFKLDCRCRSSTLKLDV